MGACRSSYDSHVFPTYVQQTPVYSVKLPYVARNLVGRLTELDPESESLPQDSSFRRTSQISHGLPERKAAYSGDSN